jgi:hypothetical protein
MTIVELYESALAAAKDAINSGTRFEPVVAALSEDGQSLLPIPVLDIRQVRSYIRRAIHAEQAQGFIYLSDSYVKLPDGDASRAILGVWGDRSHGINGEAWRAVTPPELGYPTAWERIPAPDAILAPYRDLFTQPLATISDYRLQRQPSP